MTLNEMAEGHRKAKAAEYNELIKLLAKIICESYNTERKVKLVKTGVIK